MQRNVELSGGVEQLPEYAPEEREKQYYSSGESKELWPSDLTLHRMMYGGWQHTPLNQRPEVILHYLARTETGLKFKFKTAAL
jgi:hypothetical protein